MECSAKFGRKKNQVKHDHFLKQSCFFNNHPVYMSFSFKVQRYSPNLEILLALTKALSFPVLFDGTSGSVLCVLMEFNVKISYVRLIVARVI